MAKTRNLPLEDEDQPQEEETSSSSSSSEEEEKRPKKRKTIIKSQPPSSEDPSHNYVLHKARFVPPPSNGERVLTYTEMIREAMEFHGGKATAPDICKFIEEHHPDQVKHKTKTWRNSISGQLSVNFAKDPESTGRMAVWLLNGEPQGRKRRDPGERRFFEPAAPKAKSYDPTVAEKKRKSDKPKSATFDPDRLKELISSNTDNIENETAAIELINKDHPLTVAHKFSQPGSLYGLALSRAGTVLASCSNLGTIRLWDLQEWKMLSEIRDTKEQNIEEFFVLAFTEDDRRIVASGKHKDRKKWNQTEDDNVILSTSVKVFDTITGETLCTLGGHTEEVLCLKLIKFEDNNYILTGGQDGRLIKWHMSDDYSALEEKIVFEDIDTQIVASIQFIPGCGGKYFIAACDGGLKIFDFEDGGLVQSFPNLYGYLCDCIKFVECLELTARKNETYLLTRGVEQESQDESGDTVVAKPNACHLRKLTLTENEKTPFELEEVHSFEDESYHSNMWLVKIASNGRYVVAPTFDGQMFVWNLKSQEKVAVMNEPTEQSTPIRDVLFHPNRPYMFSCGDDSSVSVYTQESAKDLQPKKQTGKASVNGKDKTSKRKS